MLREPRELGSAPDLARASTRARRRPADARTRALRLITGLASLAALVACTAPHKLISARHISCPVRKIEIRNLVTQPQREDWIAVCDTQSYACSTRERGRRLLYGCHALAAARESALAQDADGGTPDTGAAPNPEGAHAADSGGTTDGGTPP
jgi:hypothetical protein